MHIKAIKDAFNSIQKQEKKDNLTHDFGNLDYFSKLTDEQKKDFKENIEKKINDSKIYQKILLP